MITYKHPFIIIVDDADNNNAYIINLDNVATVEPYKNADGITGYKFRAIDGNYTSVPTDINNILSCFEQYSTITLNQIAAKRNTKKVRHLITETD